VPEGQRAHRVRLLRGGLALWLAVLLAFPPVAELFPIAGLQGAPRVAPAYTPDGDTARGTEPVLMQGDRPDTAVLPRLPHVEGALFPPGHKLMLPGRSASIDLLPAAKTRPALHAGIGFHRSSVGTARKPTGPPS
jgi:hypothetical protein